MTRKEETMDRERFAHLLDAYGGDFNRWPPEARALAARFAAQDAQAAAMLAAALSLDTALDAGRESVTPSPDLAARILAQAPRRQRGALDRRALIALAACAVFGVVLGSGGCLLAPAPEEDDAYFTMAFEAPCGFEDEG